MYLALSANASPKLPQNLFFVSQICSFSHHLHPDPYLEKRHKEVHASEHGSPSEDGSAARSDGGREGGRSEGKVKVKGALNNRALESVAADQADLESKQAFNLWDDES
ncbi:hypothetical protein SLEP1_g10441 [Rubroshorea leprosula]|uniref:Uncharacterized protein n=1 Tax=Rubroshorea leprosula TaxID=152421 RepID=A0AAV5IHE0_9ROSI|nr:hypothetical protein SLEP1_g10441 [Rubroshorea leprosula]